MTDVEQPTERMLRAEGLHPLTPRETRFVHEFAKDVNAYEAAKRAGYHFTKAEQAYELLEQPNIQYAVMLMLNAKDRTLDVTVQRVIEEMAQIAFANIGDFVDWNSGAVMVRAKNMIEQGKLGAIAEITEVTLPNGMTTIRFKLHNKLKALENLLAYAQEQEKTIEGESDSLSAELTRRRQRALERAEREAAEEVAESEEAHRVVREYPSDRDYLDEALDDDDDGGNDDEV